MQPVIAPRADVAQPGFEFFGAQRVHSTISIPSSAISNPGVLDLAPFDGTLDQDRVGVVDMRQDTAAGKAGERGERAVFAVDRHVTHAPAGFAAGAGRDHFVVDEQRAVEQHDVGAGEPRAQGCRHAGGARHVNQPPRPADQFDADIGAGFGGERGIVAFEIERHLAGNGEQLGIEAARQGKALVPRHGLARHQIGGQHAEDRIGGQRRKRVGGGKHGETLAFAQRQQPGHLIDLGTGQDHGADRTAARAGPRLQCRRCQELRAQVRRGVEQNPMLAVSGDGEACLGARLCAPVAGPGETADRTLTIPLRKAAACRSTEYDGGQAPHSRGLR